MNDLRERFQKEVDDLLRREMDSVLTAMSSKGLEDIRFKAGFIEALLEVKNRFAQIQKLDAET